MTLAVGGTLNTNTTTTKVGIHFLLIRLCDSRMSAIPGGENSSGRKNRVALLCRSVCSFFNHFPYGLLL